MRFRLRHYTHYHYARPVEQAHNQLRMLLRDAPGQRCLERSLRIRPRPAYAKLNADAFNNRVLYFELGRPHRDARIFVNHIVEVAARSGPEPGLTPPWESVVEELAAPDEPHGRRLHQFRMASNRLTLEAEARTLARRHFTPGRPVLDAACALSRSIHEDFHFDKEATSVATPVVEVLRKRHGVCQDFAHLMISALRGMGLAARYVSGYLETLPPPGKPRLVGADASHAWVSLWCGKLAGWQDLDPTNDLRPSDQHITTAWGRDYDDVIPLNGVISGGGRKSTLRVRVDVERLGDD